MGKSKLKNFLGKPDEGRSYHEILQELICSNAATSSEVYKPSLSNLKREWPENFTERPKAENPEPSNRMDCVLTISEAI